MEDRSQAGLEEHTGDLQRLWQEQRRKATEFLSAQKLRLDDLEARLSADLDQISGQLGAALEENSTEHAAEITRLRSELESQQFERDRLQKQASQDLAGRDERLRAQQEAFDRRESERDLELTTLRQQLAQVQQDVLAAATQLESVRGELEQARSEVETARAGRQSGAAAESQLAELRKQYAQLETEVTAANKERSTVKADAANQLGEVHTELKRLQDALAAATALQAQTEAELAQLRTTNADLARQVGESTTMQSELAKLRETESQFAKMRAESEQSSAELAEAQRRVLAADETIAKLRQQLENANAASGQSSPEDAQKVHDLEKKHELAIEDVRNLKKRNAELEQKLLSVKGGGGDAAAARDGSSWEAMKERMLAEMEADTDDTPERKKERLAINDAIRMTDDIVTQKIREIEDLKALLEEQSHTVGDVAVGAAAISEIFDQDELIRQERERLQQAQTEWRDKLRQAEVDISVERARIGRERAEFEEKLRALEAERSQIQAGGTGGKHGKPARGRWLERLGLKDSDKA